MLCDFFTQLCTDKLLILKVKMAKNKKFGDLQTVTKHKKLKFNKMLITYYYYIKKWGFLELSLNFLNFQTSY